MATDFAPLLRGAGLRVTRPRLAVLAAVETRPHSDTATITSAVREGHSVSHQTVYDCLAALTSGGLLRRLQPTGSVTLYELQTGDNHHHLVCRGCGALTDVACGTGSAPCLHPSDTVGFDVDEAEVTYWGTCSACRPHRIPTLHPRPTTREEPDVDA